MDLQTYIKEKKHQLTKFEGHYSTRSIKSPKNYPGALTRDEWDDRFYAWIEDLYDNKESDQ